MIHPSFQTWWNSQSSSSQEFLQGVGTGLAIGSIVPTVVNPIEKVNAQIQVNSYRINFLKALQMNPLKGVSVSILNGMMKNVLLFGTLPLFQRITDSYIENCDMSFLTASICASIMQSYTLSPLQVLKVRLYTQQEKTVSAVLKAMPKNKRFQLLFAGSFASALKNSLYWPSYLLTSNYTLRLLKEQQVPNWLSPLLSGSLGGFVACSLNYPLDVIAKRQKIDNLSPSMIQTTVKIWQEEGIQGFFKGMLKAQFTRIVIAGVLTQVIYDQSNQLFKSFDTSLKDLEES